MTPSFGELGLDRAALAKNGLLYLAILLGLAGAFSVVEFLLKALFHFELNASAGEALASAYVAAYAAGIYAKRVVGALEAPLRSKLALLYTAIQTISIFAIGGVIVLFLGPAGVSAGLSGVHDTILIVVFLIFLIFGAGLVYLMSRFALAQAAKFIGRGNQANAGSTV